MITLDRPQVKPTIDLDPDGFFPTPEDAAYAMQLFGEISDARDAAIAARHDDALPGPGRDEPDYATEPVDDDALADLAEHLDREEAIDPAELDAWDAGPADDPDDMASRHEQQELAEVGISGPNRGFWGFGHHA